MPRPGVPSPSGVLTTDSIEQAIARALRFQESFEGSGARRRPWAVERLLPRFYASFRPRGCNSLIAQAAQEPTGPTQRPASR
jgi:hypothetical protein